MKWFIFSDVHSGGGRKTPFEFWLIEADNEDKAIEIFMEESGENPFDIACACCGSNFSTNGPFDTLEAVAECYKSGGYSVAEFLAGKPNSIKIVKNESVLL